MRGLEPVRVLVVDDEDLVVKALCRALEGHVVVSASSGREAIELLKKGEPFDLVLCDVMMPDLDGMAVLETMGRENLKTPVIVQTASSSLDTVVTAMRHGAADFFGGRGNGMSAGVLRVRGALRAGHAAEGYARSTGKVRWVFVNFPLTSLHSNAVPAAETPAPGAG